MNVVMIVPTGIGCSIGGHAGDATPVARLIASVCDNLLLHPNVVNSSDLNEMTENSWYIEGSILDRFLEGEFYLYKPKANKILVVADDSLSPETRNSINASMYTLGTEIEVISLTTPLKMEGYILEDRASGKISGTDELINQISNYNFDALAIHTKISVDDDVAVEYLRNGGINPYGGVEAILSKRIANIINKPVAHAPVEELEEPYNGIVKARMAASAISSCYLNSVLKGLHRAPRVSNYTKINSLGVDDIDCLVTPINCVGRPHRACLDKNIPVIAVRDNETTLKVEAPSEFIVVSNYLEAVGLITSIKSGINLKTLLTRDLYELKFVPKIKCKIYGCSA